MSQVPKLAAAAATNKELCFMSVDKATLSITAAFDRTFMKQSGHHTCDEMNLPPPGHRVAAAATTRLSSTAAGALGQVIPAQ